MANATEVMRIRIDPKLKLDATKQLDAMGLDLPTVMRILLKRLVVEKALPFEVRVPNAKTRSAMREAEAGGLKSSKSRKAMYAALNAED